MNETEYKQLSLKQKLDLALSISLPGTVRLFMLSEQWVQTRCYFARREDLTQNEIAKLATDDDHMIRLCIAKRNDLTDEQVASFVSDSDPNVRHSIARNPLLSPQQQKTLQQDDDPLVKIAAQKGPRQIKYRQRAGQARLIR